MRKPSSPGPIPVDVAAGFSLCGSGKGDDLTIIFPDDDRFESGVFTRRRLTRVLRRGHFLGAPLAGAAVAEYQVIEEVHID